MMRDRHVHAEKTILPGFGHRQAQALIAEALGVAAPLPKTTATGCGLRRPLSSASTVPEQITCLACREWLHAECVAWAGIARAAAAAAEAEPSAAAPAAPADLRAEERTYLALAARSEVTR